MSPAAIAGIIDTRNRGGMIYDSRLELELMVLLAREVAATPDTPAAARAFFRHLAETFAGTSEEFLAHVQRSAAGWFPAAGPRPRWLQAENWLWGSDGKPMTFLGQLDITATARAFPWDCSIYVFVDQADGELHNVLQRS